MPEQTPDFNTIKEINDMLTLTETLQRLRSNSKAKLQDLHLDPFYEKMIAIIRKKITEVASNYPSFDFNLGMYGIRMAKRVASRWLDR